MRKQTSEKVLPTDRFRTGSHTQRNVNLWPFIGARFSFVILRGCKVSTKFQYRKTSLKLTIRLHTLSALITRHNGRNHKSDIKQQQRRPTDTVWVTGKCVLFNFRTGYSCFIERNNHVGLYELSQYPVGCNARSPQTSRVFWKFCSLWRYMWLNLRY